jgi:hypothetical protein
MIGARSARPLRRVRFVERVAALSVAATLVVTASPASAHFGPANASEIERLYLEGQDLFAANDLNGAADAWTRLLNLMPESGTNRATRENVLINILAAHLEAYRRMRNEDGSRPIENLRTGKETLDRYYADFKQVHGDRTAVSAAVQEKGDELERELAEAEAKLAEIEPEPDTTEPEITGPDITGPDVTHPPPPPARPQNEGMGLIIGGAATAGVGAILLASMVPIGAIRGREAEEDYSTARDAGDEDAMGVAERNGNRANAILGVGAGLGGAMLVGGIVVLTLGIVKRKRSQDRITSMGPVLDRNFAGFSVRGRF